jgi:hypothetical protein
MRVHEKLCHRLTPQNNTSLIEYLVLKSYMFRSHWTRLQALGICDLKQVIYVVCIKMVTNI